MKELLEVFLIYYNGCRYTILNFLVLYSHFPLRLDTTRCIVHQINGKDRQKQIHTRVEIVRWNSMQNQYFNRTLTDFVEKLSLAFEVAVEKVHYFS